MTLTWSHQAFLQIEPQLNYQWFIPGIVHWITRCTQTPAPISPAAPALIYHHGHDRQHICVWKDWVRKEGSEGGTTVRVRRVEGAERGKSRRKYGSKEDSDRTIGKAFLRVIFCLKGPILPFARPLSILPASSLITRCRLTPSATGQLIVLGLYYSPYTAGVIWKSIKELKEWTENVDLQRFMLPYKSTASLPMKGQVCDDQLLDVGLIWNILF